MALDRAGHNRLAARWGGAVAAVPVGAVLVTLAVVWQARDASNFGVREAFGSALLTAAVAVALGGLVTALIRVLAFDRARGQDRPGLRRMIAAVGLAASAWFACVAALLLVWGMLGD